MCDASGNSDDVYIDEIEFRGLTAGKSGAALLTEGTPALPDRVTLSQNHPNPFNPMTTIEFSLPRETHTLLRVFDVRGQVVATLADQMYGPGVHSVSWDARDAASGVYFYRLETKERVETRKMILIK